MNHSPEDQSPPAWLQMKGAAPLPIRGHCSIGRSRSNQVCLPSEKVSRRHALVHSLHEGQYWLVDLGSSNGTFLNGRRLTQPVQLHDGDQVGIASFSLVFRQRESTMLHVSQSVGETLREIRLAPSWLLLGDIAGSTGLATNMPPAEAAALTGKWLEQCRLIVEEANGTINKFLGDGFLAYWEEREGISGSVAECLESLNSLQVGAMPPFRLVVHYGEIVFGGSASLGEESLSGSEVNFLFRMEKLASGLNLPFLASAPAADQLNSLLSLHLVGSHQVPSFPGQFEFYSQGKLL
jgi:adenylate cyclase